MQSQGDRQLTALIRDPSEVSVDPKGDNIILIAHDNGDESHWMVIADGEPVAKICLQDQPEEFRNKLIFVSDTFGQTMRKSIAEVGLAEVLKSSNARLYVAAVNESDAAKQLKKDVEEKLAADYEQKGASFTDNFLNHLSLAEAASRKNFIVQNPLKNSLFDLMKSAGVADPIPLIEEAFGEAGQEFFDNHVKQAMEWMNYSPAAIAELRQVISGMQHRIPEEVDNNKQYGGRPPAKVASASIPLMTTGSPDTPGSESAREGVKSRIRLRQGKASSE